LPGLCQWPGTGRPAFGGLPLRESFLQPFAIPHEPAEVHQNAQRADAGQDNDEHKEMIRPEDETVMKMRLILN
jgi:hypothetical protein